jgi:hypothetical protein
LPPSIRPLDSWHNPPHQ